ncbi:hypothetical protein DL89DRAFT_261784 [Linderina pennispora]|uniref:Uncharacterized protein n=1 Tax=Linderina pennispora TaxID=61395 RepID=A0A1Y1VUB9_9FUNG|nr:uncharacterized protein DL89DRAFT_261784 [Linderina pennispora]ORX64882.1 hypothetical protein DL89DRAFT_261784 [Linderina pennispora]
MAIMTSQLYILRIFCLLVSLQAKSQMDIPNQVAQSISAEILSHICGLLDYREKLNCVWEEMARHRVSSGWAALFFRLLTLAAHGTPRSFTIFTRLQNIDGKLSDSYTQGQDIFYPALAIAASNGCSEFAHSANGLLVNERVVDSIRIMCLTEDPRSIQFYLRSARCIFVFLSKEREDMIVSDPYEQVQSVAKCIQKLFPNAKGHSFTAACGIHSKREEG